MFSAEVWDGLAKIGTFEYKSKKIKTPALFPVVDPAKQEVPIKDIENKFGFNQTITSAYLMSKRMQNIEYDNLPDVHDYLDFKNLVMMDSGAYQIMLYGDIELGVEETIRLQQSVKTEIGVIMDHPIGYKVSRKKAELRVKNTLDNLQRSIELIGDSDVCWTLPIQGGKYLDLLQGYLEEVTNPEIINHFGFYALGSVVPLMINQDYSTLVDMIAITRNALPVDKPLHLFGAGHPAMFALATFLGCDTFDSAAYILMAKDGRYMTVNGTKQLSDLRSLPCVCPVCHRLTAKELQQMNQVEQRASLAEHNLWVSKEEVANIHQAIQEGTLWDLVMMRATSVPNMYRATRKAINLVTNGNLGRKFEAGSPFNKPSSIRVVDQLDTKRPQFNRMMKGVNEILYHKKYDHMIVVVHRLHESLYSAKTRKLHSLEDDVTLPCFLIPYFGIVPVSFYDMHPLGQITIETDDQIHLESIIKKLDDLLKFHKCEISFYGYEDMANMMSSTMQDKGIRASFTRNPVNAAISDNS